MASSVHIVLLTFELYSKDERDLKEWMTLKLNEDLKIKEPIVLMGMMGCGKSHVGHVLANNLNLKFFDMDSSIEEDQGSSVSKIFSDYGEKYFRELETQKIKELLQMNRCVISTGGGLVTTPENMAMIKSIAISIWLKSDVQTILERLDGDDSRPLLQKDDRHKTLEDLLMARKALYSKADIHIDNDGEVETIVNKIEQELGKYNEAI